MLMIGRKSNWRERRKQEKTSHLRIASLGTMAAILANAKTEIFILALVPNSLVQQANKECQNVLNIKLLIQNQDHQDLDQNQTQDLTMMVSSKMRSREWFHMVLGLTKLRS